MWRAPRKCLLPLPATKRKQKQQQQWKWQWLQQFNNCVECSWSCYLNGFTNFRYISGPGQHSTFQQFSSPLQSKAILTFALTTDFGRWTLVHVEPKLGGALWPGISKGGRLPSFMRCFFFQTSPKTSRSMFFSEHRLKMTSLRIGKHRIAKNIALFRKVNIAHP